MTSRNYALRVKRWALALGALVFAACSGGGVAPSDIRPAGSERSGLQVFQGVITANQIDVSADDGSLLPERLNVGDEVYILVSPQGGARPGWVRISRSPDDTAGIGWVERKSVRSYGRYKSASGGSPAAVDSTIPLPVDTMVPSLDPMPSSQGVQDPLDALPPMEAAPLEELPLLPIEPEALPVAPDGTPPPADVPAETDDPLFLLPPG